MTWTQGRTEIDFLYHLYYTGARDSVVVKALCYKPEDRGYETR
jgi:hypothetical protein